MLAQTSAKWVDRWKDWRNRLVSSPRFQTWAAEFPLTRRTAARQAGTAFDLCAGFVYTQILTACVRLDVLQKLSGRARSAHELANEIALDPDATRRLLRAASTLDLVETRSGSRWGLGRTGAAFLANPGALAMIAHNAELYGDLSDPVALLRRRHQPTSLSAYWPYASESTPKALTDVAVEGYSRLMSASLPMLTQDVLDAYPFSKHHRIMDVGGGEGVFLAAIADRAPAADLVLFDLPAVTARAEARQGKTADGGRMTFASGDFTTTPLPKSADLVLLVRILLDHDDDTVLALLRNITAATTAGSKLLIAEPVADTPGAERISDAYFGFYLLAMGRGRVRTIAEHTALLNAAGFDTVRRLHTRRPLLTCLISAQRSTKTARSS